MANDYRRKLMAATRAQREAAEREARAQQEADPIVSDSFSSEDLEEQGVAARPAMAAYDHEADPIQASFEDDAEEEESVEVDDPIEQFAESSWAGTSSSTTDSVSDSSNPVEPHRYLPATSYMSMSGVLASQDDLEPCVDPEWSLATSEDADAEEGDDQVEPDYQAPVVPVGTKRARPSAEKASPGKGSANIDSGSQSPEGTTVSNEEQGHRSPLQRPRTGDVQDADQAAPAAPGQ